MRYYIKNANGTRTELSEKEMDKYIFKTLIREALKAGMCYKECPADCSVLVIQYILDRAENEHVALELIDLWVSNQISVNEVLLCLDA